MRFTLTGLIKRKNIYIKSYFLIAFYHNIDMHSMRCSLEQKSKENDLPIKELKIFWNVQTMASADKNVIFNF